MKDVKGIRLCLFLGIAAATAFAITSCEKREQATTNFSKADSVTEAYLVLQDSMLGSWNAMMSDDNHKLNAMRGLLHELSATDPEKTEDIRSFKTRLDQLTSMRYDQHTLGDSEIVSEYDFASNALVSELISLAESQSGFASDSTLQRLVDKIREADQRVNSYRENYDRIASRFNVFIEKNTTFLKGMDQGDSLPGKKPLFQMASGD